MKRRRYTPPTWNPILGYEDGIPVLRAIPYTPEGFLKVWCPDCETWHFHGKGEGHRVAHCREKTSMKRTGYILRVVHDGATNTNSREA